MVSSRMSIASMNINFLRVLRVLRVVRIVKAIRVLRFFRDLRVMVHSILECFNSLISALALLVLVTYVFAVFITQHIADFFASGDLHPENIFWDDSMLRFLIIRFGTLGRSMSSLYQAVTSGIDWGELNQALMSTSLQPHWVGIFFASYIAVTGIAIMNIVTGIFVDNAIKKHLQDKDMVIHDELAREGSYMNEVKKMFEEADHDHSGELTWAEFEVYLEDDRVKAYFNSLEIHHSAARGLFKLLDSNENGRVSCEEFVMGCARLKGGARGVDVATLLYENKKLLHELSKFISNCMSELKEIVVQEEKVNTSLVGLIQAEEKMDQEIVKMDNLISANIDSKASHP
eukprot:gnl/MRDRNA2_/MRDRNA2_162593_c0_seq1.p1 gnl/MRDRNA2_/MRDRNA2_162593_c0~~gnl/MRDRNA2_/MRDRNA2_162593_c0_seq1.p1  ORF type:complete len:361 (+),score=63.22 gnl/MRDRNA2_/MRDRNA2_162593_c0_seq1:50-1084(+)